MREHRENAKGVFEGAADSETQARTVGGAAARERRENAKGVFEGAADSETQARTVGGPCLCILPNNRRHVSGKFGSQIVGGLFPQTRGMCYNRNSL